MQEKNRNSLRVAAVFEAVVGCFVGSVQCRRLSWSMSKIFTGHFHTGDFHTTSDSRAVENYKYHGPWNGMECYRSTIVVMDSLDYIPTIYPLTSSSSSLFVVSCKLAHSRIVYACVRVSIMLAPWVLLVHDDGRTEPLIVLFTFFNSSLQPFVARDVHHHHHRWLVHVPIRCDRVKWSMTWTTT